MKRREKYSVDEDLNSPRKCLIKKRIAEIMKCTFYFLISPRRALNEVVLNKEGSLPIQHLHHCAKNVQIHFLLIVDIPFLVSHQLFPC